MQHYLDLTLPQWQAAAIGAAALALVCVIAALVAARRARAHLSEANHLHRQLAALEPVAARVPVLEDQIDALRADLIDEQVQTASLAQRLESLQETHQQRLADLAEMRKQMEDRFQSLASGALSANSEKFLSLVSERFKTHKQSADEDLNRRHAAISDLVKPLDERLGKFDERMGQIEKARNEAYGMIRQQVLSLTEGQASLGQETRRLVQALRAPKTRGRWGEMQLRQVFEMAGMSERVDFDLEHSFDTDQGQRRPDAIVHIPGGKSIVIDAKTPLSAYLDALEAETPDAQSQFIKQHAMQVRKHVNDLSSKSYQDNLTTTPDFVVMFIPGETFVSAAAEADPGLIEYAFERKVLIATPTTLMALVKAIAYGWQQDKMAENAVEVQKTAKEIYDRLRVFAEHLGKVGRSLGASVDHYNRALGSLEGRVLPSARKFEQLGVVSPSADKIEKTDPIEYEPRRLTAHEFDQTAQVQDDA
ncbi:DNA recombination protein RmuC [Roseovarius dicentrarchi]|uniref:DNA recombination protein RmuC n=1 Tax=Roseovarius dicentrarchi TaxID=2250573 RepID=UPI000DE9B529|nr:DNA recombination protein RmuC [Roseovarius dicentrarchi]